MTAAGFEGHLDRGLDASTVGDWPEAVSQFRQAVALAPDNSVIHLQLGMALNLMGDAGAAMGHLAEAVRLDPELAQAHFTMGTLAERSGRDGEAIGHYMVAATHDSGVGETHHRLADALRRAGRFEASLPYYEQVVERSDARFGQAMALVQLRRFGEAREHLSVGMDRHPWEPAFALALARLLAAAPDGQIRDGQRALELVQTLAEELRTTAVAETMAMAHAELGQFPQAVEWQRLAMSVATEAGQSVAARQMSVNLALYLRGQPCRTPWRNDELE